MTVKWKEGFGSLYNGADAQRVAAELSELGETFTPAQIVERAKDEQSELHKCFEWDDTIAADKYRKQQARMIVCHLVVAPPDEESESGFEYRVYYKPQSFTGYTPTKLIIRNDDKYTALLMRAKEDALRFKEKYNALAELDEVMEAIDKTF